ncbi:MAG: DUF1295 domain-containing protein [Roseburia sp.]|nr:DUF1295 domain-containing protein [Roseburia sp.]
MDNIKKNKPFSFCAIIFIYAVAAASAIFIYRALPLDWRLSLFIADVCATVIVFVFSLIFKNASVYDPYWSVQSIVIVVAFAIAYGLNVLSALFLAVICAWGIRLTANWAYTFGNLSCQDWRYTMLREKTDVFYPIINFVGIHLVPTLVVYGVTLPAAEIILSAPPINAGSVVFLCISVCAFTMQGVADVQMHKYRKNRNGTFIRSGLWKYSRHPNYLGEILMWWGVGLALVCALPSKWYYLAGAVANTLLFLFVSIPLAEGRQSHKDGYAEYKKQTRMLLPIYKNQKL